MGIKTTNKTSNRVMNLEDRAREYADGKSSASVFRDAHIRDFKAGYNQALKDTRFDEMLELLKEHLSYLKSFKNDIAEAEEYLIFKTSELIKQATEL